MSEPELTNKYRDNLKIDALRADVDAIKVDLTNFVGALLQSGIVELVKDETGEQRSSTRDHSRIGIIQ